MTNILVYIATSLDGFIAKEDGGIDWLPEDSESSYDAFYKSIDAVIMGKTTYDQVLTFGEYPYKDKKSFVFTRSSKNSNDNVEFVSDIEKFVKDGFTGGHNIQISSLGFYQKQQMSTTRLHKTRFATQNSWYCL